MPEVNAAWLALVGALLGGTGLKIVDYWLTKGRTKEDMARAFRDEIRGDLKTCREELFKAEKDLDAWKERYYDLIQDCLEEHGGLPTRDSLREVDRNND